MCMCAHMYTTSLFWSGVVLVPLNSNENKNYSKTLVCWVPLCYNGMLMWNEKRLKRKFPMLMGQKLE